MKSKLVMIQPLEEDQGRCVEEEPKSPTETWIRKMNKKLDLKASYLKPAKKKAAVRHQRSIGTRRKNIANAMSLSKYLKGRVKPIVEK